MRGSWRIAAIVAAATVGNGVFALPFVFYKAGWLIGLFYLAALGTIIAAAHTVYLGTLEKVGEKERLLGLAGKYLGRGGFWAGFIAIVAGLLLTLVAYLILGAQFIGLALPDLPLAPAFVIFWLFISLPIFLENGRVADLEFAGITCTAGIIFLIFFSAWPNIAFNGAPAVNPREFFLPFGAVLFSLAGWTSIEPAYEMRKRFGAGEIPWKPLAAGTFFAAALYIMFSAGIIGSAATIAQDTVSGLSGWPLWKKEAIALMGLIAVATVYLPISREIKNALEKDLRWNKYFARAAIMFLPLIPIALGVNDFLAIIGLVGGVFVATQYLLIISVGRRALALSKAKKFSLDAAVIVFIAAAVYEVWTFIVH